MKIAVLSDIHGNHIALEKCMEEIKRRGIQKLLFLGDYIGELAYPQKTMIYIRKLIQDYECYFIRGNKEDYWLERENDKNVVWREGDSTTGMMLYGYKNLNEDDIAFFKSLKYMQTLSFDGLPTIAAYHGSHSRTGNKLKLKDDNLHILFEDTGESIVLCGHTHKRKELIMEGRVLLNPGSVGLPLDSKGLSQFLILSGENGKWSYEFVDMAYDIDAAIQELHEEKLFAVAPCWTRTTEYVLRHGDVSHGTVLSRAMQLLHEDTGKWCWPDIPEKYWEKAVAELIG